MERSALAADAVSRNASGQFPPSQTKSRPSRTKKNGFGFSWISSSDSGLFNGLPALQIKKMQLQDGVPRPTTSILRGPLPEAIGSLGRSPRRLTTPRRPPWELRPPRKQRPQPSRRPVRENRRGAHHRHDNDRRSEKIGSQSGGRRGFDGLGHPVFSSQCVRTYMERGPDFGKGNVLVGGRKFSLNCLSIACSQPHGLPGRRIGVDPADTFAATD